MGEAYSPNDDEDMAMATAKAVSIPQGCSRTDVTMAKAGNWILLGGMDANISKTATITSAIGDESNPAEDDDIQSFAPLYVNVSLLVLSPHCEHNLHLYASETFLHLGWK